MKRRYFFYIVLFFCNQSVFSQTEDYELFVHDDWKLKKDKDDIARILIKKIKTLDVCVQELNLNIETFENRIKIHTSQLEEQRHVFAHLRLKAKTYQGDKKIDERDINIFELNHHGIICESSKEEIEWELIQRKEILKGGEQ